MKALTIRQPWASLIAAGVKTIETRSWSTKYRGPLAIHAGKSPRSWIEMDEPSLLSERGEVEAVMCALGVKEPDDRSWPSPFIATGWWAGDGPEYIGIGDLRMPLGAVVATCTLADVVPIVASDDFSALAPYVRPMENRSALRRTNAPSWPDDVTDQIPFGDFTPGRYAWLLEDITPCDPVSAKGRQGLWNWQP